MHQSEKKPNGLATIPKRLRIWAYRHMPILEWLPSYQFHRDFKFDLIAGITVGMMIIPQSISLSSIMGVPPIYGLYTAAITPMIYPIFGTSRVLSVANAAEVSLLVGVAIESIEDLDERIATGIFLSLYSGVIMLVMGLCHLGLIVDFFSRPVMGGFVSAGGILIMVSQFKHWFGVNVKSSEFAFVTIYRICSELSSISYSAFILGCFSIALLAFMKYAKNNLLKAPRLDELFGETNVPLTPKTVNGIEDNTTTMEPVQNSHMLLETPKNVTWSFSLTDNEYLSLENIRQQKRTNGHVLPHDDRLDVTYENQSNASEFAAVPSPASIPNEMSSHSRLSEAKANRKLKLKLLLNFLAKLLCDLGALVICAIGILVGYLIDNYASFSIPLTGHVPDGFPSPVLPWSHLGDLIPMDKLGRISFNAFVIAIIAYMSSIAMAKRLAIKGGYEVNPNQELLGIGMASVVGSFFQSMPPTGAMSRTAVNAQNARTQLASILTSCIVIIVILFATQPLSYLPKATLASIIIVAAYSLIEIEEAKWLYRVKREEFWVWTASFGLTVVLGVLPGLVASIASSLFAIMWRTKRPPLIHLGKLENGTFVDRELFPEACTINNIEIVRIEGSLYFANCEYVQKSIENFVNENQREQEHVHIEVNTNEENNEYVIHGSNNQELHGIIIDACSINDWDATAIHVMKDLLQKLKKKKIVLAIANVRKNLDHALQSSGFVNELVQGSPICIGIDQAIEIIRLEHQRIQNNQDNN